MVLSSKGAYKMKKYNVKLLKGKGGYLSSCKLNSGKQLLFLGFKDGKDGIQTEFTKEEIKAIDERYLNFIEEV